VCSWMVRAIVCRGDCWRRFPYSIASVMRLQPCADRASRALHVFIVAGEPSGDALGAGVMTAMRSQLSAPQQHAVRFSGIGGPLMREAGLESVFDMAELAVMGLAELIPHLPRLYMRLHEAQRAVIDTKPDILLTIDSKGFNFRLLRAVAASEARPSLTAVHYVAPSVWAYKGDHSKTMNFLGDTLDLLLVLFPFERPLFDKHVPTGGLYLRAESSSVVSLFACQSDRGLSTTVLLSQGFRHPHACSLPTLVCFTPYASVSCWNIALMITIG
jgi:hypothetical protein